MTKEEKIKEAWGDLYLKFDSFLDENGNLDSIFLNPEEMKSWKNGDYPNIIYFNGYFFPKDIQDIKTNNGWIKIESEDDLPKEYGLYWTVSDGKIGLDNFKDEFDKECWLEEYTDGNLTHYQPIEKPKPPMY